MVKVSQQCGLSMDWLMFGKGDESTPVASHTQVASPTSRRRRLRRGGPDLDLLCIPLVAASLSAGVGSLQTEADVLDYFAFRSDWLCRKGNPDKMVLMKVYGDSMEPEICHGDMALIDQSKQQIYPHTIYAVGVNEEIYIKQIETLPGHRMLLRSLNERYEPSKWIARRHGRVRPHHRQGHLVVSGSVRNKEDWGKGGENFLKKVLSSPSPTPPTPHPSSLKDF